MGEGMHDGADGPDVAFAAGGGEFGGLPAGGAPAGGGGEGGEAEVAED